MGLDVYLYKCPDLDLARAAQAEYERRSDEVMSAIKGDDAERPLTAEESAYYRERMRVLRAELGLGEYGEHSSMQEVRIDSKLHPEHLFKIGYFRSSYNDSGIEHVLLNLGIPGLADIFPTGGQYEFRPDWPSSLARAKESLRLLREYQARPEAKFCVVRVPVMMPDPSRGSPISAKEALAKFLEQWQLWQSESDSLGSEYHNYVGLFSRDGLKVHAVLSGYEWGPTNFVVVARDPRYLDWYVQALEIVVETCEYVLAQPDPQNYLLHWSG